MDGAVGIRVWVGEMRGHGDGECGGDRGGREIVVRTMER